MLYRTGFSDVFYGELKGCFVVPGVFFDREKKVDHTIVFKPFAPMPQFETNTVECDFRAAYLFNVEFQVVVGFSHRARVTSVFHIAREE